jgi:hypothetical protein
VQVGAGVGPGATPCLLAHPPSPGPERGRLAAGTRRLAGAPTTATSLPSSTSRIFTTAAGGRQEGWRCARGSRLRAQARVQGAHVGRGQRGGVRPSAHTRKRASPRPLAPRQAAGQRAGDQAGRPGGRSRLTRQARPRRLEPLPDCSLKHLEAREVQLCVLPVVQPLGQPEALILSRHAGGAPVTCQQGDSHAGAVPARERPAAAARCTAWRAAPAEAAAGAGGPGACLVRAVRCAALELLVLLLHVRVLGRAQELVMVVPADPALSVRVPRAPREHIGSWEEERPATQLRIAHAAGVQK